MRAGANSRGATGRGDGLIRACHLWHGPYGFHEGRQSRSGQIWGPHNLSRWKLLIGAVGWKAGFPTSWSLHCRKLSQRVRCAGKAVQRILLECTDQPRFEGIRDLEAGLEFTGLPMKVTKEGGVDV